MSESGSGQRSSFADIFWQDKMSFFLDHPFLAFVIVVLTYFLMKKIICSLFRTVLEDLPRKYPEDAAKVGDI